MKTAVEWLEDKLKESLGDNFDPVRGYFVMAKDVEEVQIRRAFCSGEVARDRIDAEQYYNETFEK